MEVENLVGLSLLVCVDNVCQGPDLQLCHVANTHRVARFPAAFISFRPNLLGFFVLHIASLNCCRTLCLCAGW